MSIRQPALTLHEAMVQVLKKCEDQTAEHGYLVDRINEEKLYWQVNGDPVKANQIGPRAKNYPGLFEKISKDPKTKSRARIRLK